MRYPGKPVSSHRVGYPATASQARFRFEPEMDLAAAITAHLGRDLFAGVTDPAERKARARIALILDKLEGIAGLGALFESIYGEPLRLPQTAPVTAATPTRRKRVAA
jgi:hypothetical protein